MKIAYLVKKICHPPGQNMGQARVQEFVKGGGPKSESLFFCFLIFQGGGPAQKIAEKMIFLIKKVAKHR